MIVTLHYVRQRTFVLFLVGAIAYSAGSKMNNETRLLQDLFRGYDMNARPVLNNSDSVKVSLNFQIIRIIELNAKDQYIKVLAWFDQYWNNPLLVWDPENYGGIKTIHVQPKEVWVPDILLYNNLDDKDTMAGGRTTYLTNVALSYDGSNAWLNPALFKSICNIDITNFPFDDQTCKLKFGSWSFSIAGIDSYAWNNTRQLSPYYNKNGEWQILDVAVARNVVKYQCCPNAFVDVTVTIDLRRECMDYILKLIIPCSLISSMSFLGFVLPPESGERIGLSITVLLAMTVFQQLSSELMPSYGFPILGQYYFAIILEIGLSLFMTTLILNFYHRNRKMSKYTRKLLLHWLARIAFPWQKSTDRNPASQTEGQSNQQNQENGKQSSDRQRHCSEDSLSFDERLFAYSPSSNDGQNCHMNINEPSGSARTPPSERTEDVETNHAYDNNGMVGSTGAINGVPGNNFPSQSTEETLKGTDISKNPVCLAQMLAIHSGDCLVAPSDAKLQNQKEWMKAARVLDRLFLVISVVLTLGTMFAIFMRAPRFQYIL